MTALLTDECIIFTGFIRKNGYGWRWDRVLKKPDWAHRVAYRELIGPIPEGLHIDHLCFNRACINPDHLEAVTRAENQRRMGARTTHCPRGHLYEAPDAYPKGKRYCRPCCADKERKRRAAQRKLKAA